MAKPKIRGSKFIVKPTEYSFDPRAGQIVRVVMKSAGGPGALLGHYASARSRGLRGRLKVSPLISELEIESPDSLDNDSPQTEFITDTWQIVGNELTKAVYENPITIGIIGATVLNAIAGAIRTGGPKPSSAAGADATQLWNEIQAGQDTVATGQYVLRHTTNCSPSSTNNVSDFNVECLYTTAQLLTEVLNPALWQVPIPTRLYNKILSIGTPAGIDAYHLWSWRKLPSTETTTPNNRIEINTEYWLDAWSTLRYALAS